MEDEPVDPIHVLCLHGCCQDVDMFQSILKDYIKIGERTYNLKFHFLEGTYDFFDDDETPRGKTWYCEPLDIAEIGKISFREDLVRSAMVDLETAIEDTGATVLFGFSQGGNVADTYLAHYDKEKKIQKAVLCSTYPLVDGRTPNEHVKVLSIFSTKDLIVPPIYRPRAYTHLTEMTHEKGHKIITSKPKIREILEFISMNRITIQLEDHRDKRLGEGQDPSLHPRPK